MGGVCSAQCVGSYPITFAGIPLSTPSECIIDKRTFLYSSLRWQDIHARNAI